MITALQAAAAMDRTRFFPIALYLAKNGNWYSGEELLDVEGYSDLSSLLQRATRVDLLPGGASRLVVREAEGSGFLKRHRRSWTIEVAFLGLHGGAGENGGMQGLCDLFDVAYTGSGVLGSALAMDKVRSKEFCSRRGIPVVEYLSIREADWAHDEDRWLEKIDTWAAGPVVVKPVSLGSSIGIRRVEDREDLDAAIEEAFRYDETIIVERAVHPLREINCSVLGDEDEARASLLEEPVSRLDVLSFEEKYMRGGESGKGPLSGHKGGNSGQGMASLDRVIPAPLTDEQTESIRTMAVQIFQMLGCAGVARIDFLMNGDTGEFFFNEINTIPGSLSYYLWEPTGVTFQDLVHRLIEIAQHRHAERINRIRSYDVNLLAEHSARGLKGPKS